MIPDVHAYLTYNSVITQRKPVIFCTVNHIFVKIIEFFKCQWSHTVYFFIFISEMRSLSYCNCYMGCPVTHEFYYDKFIN